MYASNFLQMPTEVLYYVDQFFLLLANKHYPPTCSCVCVPCFNLVCETCLSIPITVFLPYLLVCLVKLLPVLSESNLLLSSPNPISERVLV